MGERGRVGYVERLRPPLWLWGLVAGLGLSVGLVLLAPFGPGVAIAGGLASTGLAGWGLWVWTPTVEVADGRLRAGPASIAVDLLGEPVPLDPARAAALRGPGIDPRAFHLLPPWVPAAVRVDVRDPADPTPYWYVSTRHPHRLAAAISAAQAAARADGGRGP